MNSKVEVIDTLKENLYTVPSVQDWFEAGVQILGPGRTQQKGKLKMADETILKGGEPPKKKKKGKKKAAPKKAAKKKAAKKK